MLERYRLDIMEVQIMVRFNLILGNVENLCEQDSYLEDLSIHMLLTYAEKNGILDKENWMRRGKYIKNYGTYLAGSM